MYTLPYPHDDQRPPTPQPSQKHKTYTITTYTHTHTRSRTSMMIKGRPRQNQAKDGPQSGSRQIHVDGSGRFFRAGMSTGSPEPGILSQDRAYRQCEYVLCYCDHEHGAVDA